MEGYGLNPTLAATYFDVSSSSGGSSSSAASKELKAASTTLPFNFVLECLPRDAWVCIASFASSIADLGRYEYEEKEAWY